MKKIIVLLLMAAILPSYSPIEPYKFSLTGKWKSIDTHDSIDYLIFEADGHAAMQRGNEIIGGKEFGEGSKKGKMTYTVDFSMKPAHLDFIVTRLDTKDEMRIKSIIEVINDNEIKVAINSNPDGRPKTFDESTIMFRKVK